MKGSHCLGSRKSTFWDVQAAPESTRAPEPVILSGVFEAKDLASYYRRRSLNQFPINTGVLSFNQAQRQVASSSVL